MDELHRLIREARKERGWTRGQLAEEASKGEIEVSEEMVRYVETACQRPPRAPVLLAIAGALRIPWPAVRAAAGYE